MSYKRYEITIKYNRHPFLKDGTQDKTKIESTTWFDTIYDESKPVTEKQAKTIAKQHFLDQKISHIPPIGQIRATKQVFNDNLKKWV